MLRERTIACIIAISAIGSLFLAWQLAEPYTEETCDRNEQALIFWLHDMSREIGPMRRACNRDTFDYSAQEDRRAEAMRTLAKRMGPDTRRVSETQMCQIITAFATELDKQRSRSGPFAVAVASVHIAAENVAIFNIPEYQPNTPHWQYQQWLKRLLSDIPTLFLTCHRHASGQYTHNHESTVVRQALGLLLTTDVKRLHLADEHHICVIAMHMNEHILKNIDEPNSVAEKRAVAEVMVTFEKYIAGLYALSSV